MVLRYVERNPLHAGLVGRAEAWEWSSLHGHAQGPLALWLDPGPVPRGPQWVEAVNAPMFETDLAPIRRSLQRDAPFGSEAWTLRRLSPWVWNPASNLLGVRGRRPTKARESNSKLLAYLMHFPITGHYVPLSPPGVHTLLIKVKRACLKNASMLTHTNQDSNFREGQLNAHILSSLLRKV